MTLQRESGKLSSTKWHFIGRAEMTNSKLINGILAALMMMALGTLIACASSTDESAGDGGSGSGRDCTDECSMIPEHQYDECIATCD
jgi:hypothetical protein